jgi:hypothetical protein
MECKFCNQLKDENGDALVLHEIMEGIHVCHLCCSYYKIDFDYLGRPIYAE